MTFVTTCDTLETWGGVPKSRAGSPGTVCYSHELRLIIYTRRNTMYNFYTPAIPVLLVFIVLDFVTGIGAAIYTGTYKSECMRVGIWHKCAEIALLGLAIIIQIVSPEIGIEWGNSLVKGVCAYLILMEVGSVTENIIKINPDLAEAVKKFFGGEKHG